MAAQCAEMGKGHAIRMKRKLRGLQTPNLVEISQTKQGMALTLHCISSILGLTMSIFIDFMASIAGLGEEWAEILEKEGFENDYDLLALTDYDIALSSFFGSLCSLHINRVCDF